MGREQDESSTVSRGYDVGPQQFTVGEPMQGIYHSYANASIGSFCAAL